MQIVEVPCVKKFSITSAIQFDRTHFVHLYFIAYLYRSAFEINGDFRPVRGTLI